MAQKSAVSELQEYCAQKKMPPPTYNWIDCPDGAYICRAQVLNMEADGQGCSKRDAKHLAASNLIKRLRTEHRDMSDIHSMDVEENPTDDMVAKLRDVCVQEEHPLRVIDIVQQGGSPDAPEYIGMCSVTSIKRYGTSEKKKDAKQKAAQAVFPVIDEEKLLVHQIQVVSLDQKIDDIESESKTYRDLSEAHAVGDSPGILLSERHNYFTKFPESLKSKAFAILKNPHYYEEHKRQAMDLLAALKIQPSVTTFPALKSVEKMVKIELNCEYDVVFTDIESKIYLQVLDYFRDMLD